MKKSLFVIAFIALNALFFSCHTTSDLKSNKEETIENTTQNAQESSLLVKLKYSGIDFYARGNEPFWGLNLDYQNHFVFYGLGMDSVVFNPVKPNKAQDANALRFYSQIENGFINININEANCTDNMSGEDYTFMVDVEIDRNGSNDSYHGCGNFIPDYRLHDIWVLTEIYNDSLGGLLKLSHPLARIEFKVDERKVMGGFSCNSFSGGFWLQGNELRFKSLPSTKKYCLLYEEISAQEFYTNMRKVNHFKIEDGYLQLFNNNKLLLIYKKVD